MVVSITSSTTLSGTTLANFYMTTAGITVTNTGTITSPGTDAVNAGIAFDAQNQVLINRGVISDANGVDFNSGTPSGLNGRITNVSGATIAGTTYYGVRGDVLGSVFNSGLIKTGGQFGSIGWLRGNGYVSNSSTGSITSGGIYFASSAGTGTIVNAGLISGAGLIAGGLTSAYGGILLRNGGTVTNLAGGTITSNGASVNFGIWLQNGGGTVSNAGTIIGGTTASNIAVYFGSSTTNRLIEKPGAVFVGTVQGGGASTTLELGSGASTGTLTSLTTQFTGFGAVTIDSGASWAWAASDLLAAGITLTDSGTLINSVGFAPAGKIVLSQGVFSNASAGTLTGGIYGAAAGGTVINAGKITGTVALASGVANRVVIVPGATFGLNVNGGNTSTATGISTLELASSASSGTLTSFGSRYSNFSQIVIDTSASWNVGATDTLGAGITLNNAGTLSSSGAVSVLGTMANSGTVLIGAGTLSIANLSGSGTLAFGATSGAILAMSSAVAAVQPIGGLTIASGTISGQTIEITGQTVASAVINNGTTLALGFVGGGTLNVQLAASQAGKFFQFQTAGGNTFLELSTSVCYLAGTRIRTDKGEIPVEALAIGDKVVTLDGSAKPIKWIGRRAYSSAFAAGNRDVLPILIKRGALADNLPIRDLYVSPLHALYIDAVLVPAGQLVNGASIVRCREIDPIRYFHIELDNHDVVFAEGAPAETFIDCDSRGIFHNASSFADMYPGDRGRRWVSFAPRIESGPVLHRIRHAIAARAGLDRAGPGPLEGNFDGLDGSTISGWAFDPAQPEIPVVLEVLDGDGLIARLTANLFRSDLESAGIGDGRHGFELSLARPLSPLVRHELRVRRAIDGQELAGSPLVSEPRDRRSLVKDTNAAIDTAVAECGQNGALDGMLDTLLTSIDTVRRLRATQKTAPGDDRLLVPVAPHRAKARVALVVAELLPRRNRDAATDALLSHIEALRGLGWQIEVVASGELARGDDATAGLKAWGVTCHRAPLVASVEEVLRRKRGFYDMVYLHRASTADAYAALVRAWQPGAQVVYAAGGAPASVSAMRMADMVLVANGMEAERLRQQAPDLPVQVVPWSPYAALRKPLRQRNGVAFPDATAEALLWLETEVVPLILQRDPDMQTHVELRHARVSVAMSVEASALTSFAAGIPCAMTPAVAQAFRLRGVLRSATTDDAQTMADLICDLHHQPALNTAHARAGLRAIGGAFSADAIAAAWELLVGRGNAVLSAEAPARVA